MNTAQAPSAVRAVRARLARASFNLVWEVAIAVRGTDLLEPPGVVGKIFL